MKDVPPETPRPAGQSERQASDNLCKRLAESHPEQFAQWLFGTGLGPVKVLKTELSREPIRADSVILARADQEVLHAEFQTTIKSAVPLPLRMLDYYVGFKRQQLNRHVRQVLIVLRETGEQIPDRYEDEQTWHRYRVIKMWEQDPRALLRHEGLLPLATLCRAESGEQLLQEVAARIRRVKSRERRRDAVNLSRVLAGLRYDRGLIYRILKEGEMLEESVVYQDILQKGVQQGVQQGLAQGVQRERKLVMRQLERLLGRLSSKARKQLAQLSVEQLEALGEALVDFKSEKELTAWLKQHASTR